MIKEYISYLRDNPERYWFKARWYGWGWVPATWHGWLILGFYLVFVLWGTARLPYAEDQLPDDVLFGFIAKLVLATLAIIVVAYIKGEKPRWQWGPPDKYKRD